MQNNLRIAIRYNSILFAIINSSAFYGHAYFPYRTECYCWNSIVDTFSVKAIAYRHVIIVHAPFLWFFFTKTLINLCNEWIKHIIVVNDLETRINFKSTAPSKEQKVNNLNYDFASNMFLGRSMQFCLLFTVNLRNIRLCLNPHISKIFRKKCQF